MSLRTVRDVVEQPRMRSLGQVHLKRSPPAPTGAGAVPRMHGVLIRFSIWYEAYLVFKFLGRSEVLSMSWSGLFIQGCAMVSMFGICRTVAALVTRRQQLSARLSQDCVSVLQCDGTSAALETVMATPFHASSVCVIGFRVC